jgi:hypothetical protein
MVWTGAGQLVFLGWLGLVWLGYFGLAAFVGPWSALGGACAVAALATYLAGRALNRARTAHTFFALPAQWIGVVAPIVFGILFGVAEALRTH